MRLEAELSMSDTSSSSSQSELLDKVVSVALSTLTLGLSAEDLAFYQAVQFLSRSSPICLVRVKPIVS
jgi:hypothetical protein